jgi:hypothetical protein
MIEIIVGVCASRAQDTMVRKKRFERRDDGKTIISHLFKSLHTAYSSVNSTRLHSNLYYRY